MAVLETALISALAPAAVDALKSLFGGLSRRIAGLSVDDEIKLKTADVERVKALAELDTPVGTPTQWVVDLRASFRYVAAGVCVLSPVISIFFLPSSINLTMELASGAFGFIFGERMLLSLKQGKK